MMYDLNNQILLKQDFRDFERFGLKGIGVNFQNSFEQKTFEKIQAEIDVIPCLEVNAKSKNDISKAVQKYRNQVDVIMVNASGIEVMRAASESPKVDIISHAFIDQVAAQECKNNGIAIEVNLKDLLAVYGMKRAHLISKLKFNLGLARKYKLDVVLSTGAKSIYDMRHAKQISALAQVIGFKPEESKKSLLDIPRKIVEGNR